MSTQKEDIFEKIYNDTKNKLEEAKIKHCPFSVITLFGEIFADDYEINDEFITFFKYKERIAVVPIKFIVFVTTFCIEKDD